MFWRGVVGYLPVNIVQGIVGLLTIVVFTRVLSPADYGVYALAFSATSLVATGLFVWLEASMARFYAPEAIAGRLPAHFTTIYRTFTAMAVGFPLLAGAILWLIPMPAPLKLAFAAGLSAIMFRSLLKLAQERKRAAGDVKGAAFIDIAQTIGAFVIGAIMALIGWGGGSPLIGAGAVAVVLLVFVLPGELKHGRGGSFESARVKLYAAYGVPVAMSLILALVLATTDRFLLAVYLNDASVGVYHAGYSLANRTLDVMFIWLGMAGGPAAIAALERGGHTALRIAAREQASFMVALMLPAAAGLALVAKPLADVMIGPGLRDGAAHVTPWIAASAFLAGITTYYFHTAFTLARKTRLLMLAMALPALSNLLLNWLLIPRFGLDGALWATLASFALGALASYSLGHRALALPLPWETLWRAALATAGMATAVLLIPAVGGPVELFAKAAAGAFVYGLLALALDVCGARDQSARVMRAMQARAGMIAALNTSADNRGFAKAKPILSVLTPFFRDDPSGLLAALDREASGLDGAVEIIALDDGTGDPALAASVTQTVMALALPARFIQLRLNVGRSKGRNLMAAQARGEWLLFLDSDMLPDGPNFLRTYLDLIATEHPAVVCGGFSLDQTPLTQPHALHRRMALKSDCAPAAVRALEPEKHVFTSNLLVRRDVFAAEQFDEAFTGWGWEDVEWAMRVAKRHPIQHIDNTATHLGLDTAPVIAAKYEQSAANFARVVSEHRAVVERYPSYRVARLLKRVPLRGAWRPVLKAVALADPTPMAARDLAMRLYRAALYAEAVDDRP